MTVYQNCYVREQQINIIMKSREVMNSPYSEQVRRP